MGLPLEASSQQYFCFLTVVSVCFLVYMLQGAEIERRGRGEESIPVTLDAAGTSGPMYPTDIV